MSTTVLICTRGFADVLTLGRQHRADPALGHLAPSDWLLAVPEALRFEVGGRIDAAGREVEPLEPGCLAEALQALQPQPQAIAICLLFAHRNPAHERSLRELLAAACPDVPIACSHDQPVPGGEYERTVACLQAAGLQVEADLHAPPLAAAAGLAQRLQDAAQVAWRALAEAADAVAAAAGGGPSGGAGAAGAAAAAHGAPAGLAAPAAHAAHADGGQGAERAAAGVFRPDGTLLALAPGAPLLLGGALVTAVPAMLALWPAEGLQPGDGLLTNDPWRGAANLREPVLLRPVCSGGVVRLLLACVLRHPDLGGAPAARSVHAEGLRIPPLRLFHAGASDAALLRLLCANTRDPDALAAGLRAQWAALGTAEALLRHLAEEEGDALAPACEALLAASQEGMRTLLRDLGEAGSEAADRLELPGGAQAGLQVRLQARQGALLVDLAGCAPQVPSDRNAAQGAAAAALLHLARTIAPAAPLDAGLLQPLQWRTAPATVVDPAWPQAVGDGAAVARLLAALLGLAWGRLRHPGQGAAPHAGAPVRLLLAGLRADGSPWSVEETIAAGGGAAAWGPGAAGVSADLDNARNLPAETLEERAPVRVLQLGVRRGSGGAGRHRGGDGVVRAYRLLEGRAVVDYAGGRHQVPAPGEAGGQPGRLAEARLERSDGTVEHLPARARVAWQAGDVLVIATAGAGGWGEAPPG